jgi:sulfur carrier protein ThiS
MKVRIKLFGTLQDRYPGYNRTEGLPLDIPKNMTVGGLFDRLGISVTEGCIVIAEARILKNHDELKNFSEILIMQPISGG